MPGMDWTTEVRCSGEAGIFLLAVISRSSLSYPVGTEVSSPRGKVVGAWSRQLTSI